MDNKQLTLFITFCKDTEYGRINWINGFAEEVSDIKLIDTANEYFCDIMREGPDDTLTYYVVQIPQAKQKEFEHFWALSVESHGISFEIINNFEEISNFLFNECTVLYECKCREWYIENDDGDVIGYSDLNDTAHFYEYRNSYEFSYN